MAGALPTPMCVAGLILGHALALAAGLRVTGGSDTAAVGISEERGLQTQRSVDAGDEGIPEDYHACDGCQLTVNLRCEGMRSSRSSPFHRIQDCLLPVYGLIKLARDASLRDMKVCAVTWLNVWEGLTLKPFLVNMSRVEWHRIINEDQPCVKSLRYHTLNRTSYYMATAEHLARFAKDPNMVKAHAINIAKNLALLQMDASWLGKSVAPTNHKKANLVLIKRTTESRVFRPVALEELSRSLVHRTGHPVVEYAGTETAVHTLKLFNQAAGAVGFHGAAWVNTYFTAHWHCNVHISTFYDVQNEGKVPWRVHKELMINPWGAWAMYFLPLKMLLAANHVMPDAYKARQEKDHFIKDLEWIPLRDADVQAVSSMMATCLSDPIAYSKAHVRPYKQMDTTSLSEHGSAASGILTSRGRDACSGCDVTVDMRCQDLRYSRDDYYHTLTECLLYQYEMIQVAREASSNASANVCVLTWTSPGRDIQPFLSSFVGVTWHKIIDEGDMCASGLQLHAVDRSPNEGLVSRARQEELRRSRNLIRGYPIDVRHNMAWMHKDAVNIVGPPVASTIILQGRGRHMFPSDVLSRLASKTRQFMKMPVKLFYGGETAMDMVRLFTNTGNVLGFYGDLWINTLFTNTPHCNTQLSTYIDFDRNRSWRTGADIGRLNPLGDWYFKFVHPYPMLKANGISNDTFLGLGTADRDQVLKTLKYVPLSDEEIVVLASRTFMCWQNKERAYRHAQKFYTRDYR